MRPLRKIFAPLDLMVGLIIGIGMFGAIGLVAVLYPLFGSQALLIPFGAFIGIFVFSFFQSRLALKRIAQELNGAATMYEYEFTIGTEGLKRMLRYREFQCFLSSGSKHHKRSLGIAYNGRLGAIAREHSTNRPRGGSRLDPRGYFPLPLELQSRFHDEITHLGEEGYDLFMVPGVYDRFVVYLNIEDQTAEDIIWLLDDWHRIVKAVEAELVDGQLHAEGR